MTVAPAPSDAVLVARLRSRDRTAWEDVYRLYGDRLHRFAYHLTGNPHDAADLVQETFVRALPRLDQLDPDTVNLGAYLFATQRNLFLKGVERSKRQEPVEVVPEPSEPAAIEDDPERSTLLDQQQADVRRANASLAPRQRLVLALRELEDRSYAEIGELVGLNENAVAQLISRARQGLRAELRLVEVDRSKLPEECQALLPLLSAHLDGQLKGAAAERTLAHLESCEHCQAALADMREASRLYRSLVPILLPELLGRIDEALAASKFWARPRSGVRRAVPKGRRARMAASLGIVGAVGAVAVGAAVVGRGQEPTAEAALDVDPPRLVLPSGTLVREATSSAGARVSFTVRAGDRVDGPLTPSCSAASGDVLALGTTEVVCTATDEAGNEADGSFAVDVVDTTAPVLEVPAARSVEARSPAGAVVRFQLRALDRVDPSAASRCTPETGATFPLGKTTVECSARDASGNQSARSFVVTVRDGTAPALTLPGALLLEAGTKLRYAVAARDAVDGNVAAECSVRAGATLPIGTTNVVCTGKDRSGNVARGRFAVRVADTTAPRLRLPRNRRVEAAGPGGARVDYAASADDLVDDDVSARCSPAAGSRFPLGSTPVDCTAVDAHGNRTSGSFEITVVDTKPPVLRLPSAITVEATGPAGATVEYTAPANDRVDGGLQTACTPASGKTFPLGATTVRCSARDTSGNKATGTLRVTVVDTTAPALNLPADRSGQATSASGATVTFTASAVDAVDGPVTPSCAPTSGSVFPVGSTDVTCTARDARGNTRSGTFTVTVTPLPRADLVVSVTSTSFTVSNAGNTGSGPFTVTVQGVGSYTFRGLAAGASATRTVSCASIQRTVTVDPSNQVSESNEQNNTARIPAC